MPLRRVFALAALAAAFVASCTDDPEHHPAVATKTADYVSIDAPALCRIFVTDCPSKLSQTFDECVKIYEATRVDPECKHTLDALTCASTQADLEACWPECNGLVAECDGPHIIECSSSGRRYTYDCNGVCATQGKTWSGTCGVSYKNQTAGRATCWCN